MNRQKAIKALTTANKWRRGDELTPMPEPKEFGEAIDFAVASMSEELDVAGDMLWLIRRIRMKNLSKADIEHLRLDMWEDKCNKLLENQ